MIGGQEDRQFRRLLKGFTWRFLDNDLMSAEGDPMQTLVHSLALLSAFNLSVMTMIALKYWFLFDRAPLARRIAVSWGDTEFFISLSMAVAGAVAVLTWDAVFPDRREAMILTALPLRMRTVFAAKLVSILLLFGSVTVAANAFSMLVLPWAVMGDAVTLPALLRWGVAHVVALFGASTLVLFSFLGIQALLVSLLPYRLFQRAAALVQFAALFGILALFFLMPRIASPEGIRQHLDLALRLPPLWFLGLAHFIIGSTEPAVAILARRAILTLAAAVAGSLAVYVISYQRHVRRMIEQAEGIGGTVIRRPMLDRLTALLARRPMERAVFRFTMRTMARNRRPRLLFAIYCGVGLAWVMDGIIAALHGSPAIKTDLTAPPIVLSFFILLGMRMLFSVPVELESNWIFRLAEPASTREHYAAIRKMMFLFDVLPLALLPAPFYVWLWGPNAGIRHTLLVLLISLYLRERLLRDFDKIPFTCSYLPGKLDLKTKAGVWFALFSTLSFLVTNLERFCLTSQRGFYIFTLVLAALLAMEVLRRRGLPPSFVFEEKPEWMKMSMELR